MDDKNTTGKQRNWRKLALRILLWYLAIGTGVGLTVSILAVIFSPTSESPDSSTIGGMRAPKVGETQYIGRGNCDRAVKQLLRDPDSFQRIATQIVDVKAGEGWVAQVNFRSRNGFGGYGEGTAYCVFNGTSYRALLDEQL